MHVSYKSDGNSSYKMGNVELKWGFPGNKEKMLVQPCYSSIQQVEQMCKYK